MVKPSSYTSNISNIIIPLIKKIDEAKSQYVLKAIVSPTKLDMYTPYEKPMFIRLYSVSVLRWPLRLKKVIYRKEIK